MLVEAVPTTPKSIELDLDWRQECKLVDSLKLQDEVLHECRHPTVIQVVLEETNLDVENESRPKEGLPSRPELLLDEGTGVCHFIAEFL